MTWTYPRATVIRVVDGDTVWLDLDLGLRILHRSSCRLWGVNAPELGFDGGKEAKAWLEARLPVGKVVLVVSQGLDKYGRPLVEIHDGEPGTVNAGLINTGHAVAYYP
jgi:endonuclease YncB( thermonuclease family)